MVSDEDGNLSHVTHRSSWLLPISIIILLIAALSGVLAFVPLWSCPYCVDCDLAVFHCDNCGGGRLGNGHGGRRMALWKRWRIIGELRAMGNKNVPLLNLR
jgi:hypothetical protein